MQVMEAAVRLLLQVHLRDEELHPLLQVDAEHARGIRRHAVAVLGEPALEAAALRGGQDQDVVLADRVARLDLHAERVRAGRVGHLRRRRHPAHQTEPLLALRGLTGIRVPVLDEPRRGERVEVIDRGAVADVDLVALQHDRHRHDERELARVALEVVRHREHGAIAVAHEHDLRGVVEQLRVAGGDEEPAERVRVSRERERETERDENRQSLHGSLLT
jgi:hypothetical protein